jgi:hypothetical protein
MALVTGNATAESQPCWKLCLTEGRFTPALLGDWAATGFASPWGRESVFTLQMRSLGTLARIG